MYSKCIKRIIDIFLSLIGLIFFIIAFIIVAPLIWLEDKGPVFYNAKRLGKNGKTFKMYKFRSMKVNAPDIRNKDGSTYNGDNDPRLTKIGKILRKTSLDELPQLLNVLIGNMSFIGPRPDLPEHINKYSEEEKTKLLVLPGITGYSQAYYRNSIEWRERLKNDVYYVENISFILDLKIFFKTISTVLKKEGVFMNSDKYTVRDLDWDTDYFGVKSAKITLTEEINDDDLKEIKKIVQKYQFVVIQNDNNNNNNNKMIGKLESHLTDVNMQFERKVIDNGKKTDKNITIVENCDEIKELLDIAEKVYKYSRFINDDRLDHEKAKLLYYNWLKNAFNKEGKYLSYYAEKGNYLGYCLFHVEDKKKCVIELIATSDKAQGKGIGTKIIQSLDNFCKENGVSMIQVGTQLDNIPAQNFYIKNGFKVKTYNSSYHIWK